MNLASFLLLSSLAISSNNLLPLGDKLIEIHQFNYNMSKTTLVIINSSTESGEIDKFLASNVLFAVTIVDRRYKVMKKLKSLRWLPECSTDAVAFCDDLSECLTFIENLFQEFTINPRSLFTIILEKHFVGSRIQLLKFLRNFFEECWRRNMVQVVVVLENPERTGEILAYSYHPYKDQYLQDLTNE